MNRARGRNNFRRGRRGGISRGRNRGRGGRRTFGAIVRSRSPSPRRSPSRRSPSPRRARSRSPDRMRMRISPARSPSPRRSPVRARLSRSRSRSPRGNKRKQSEISSISSTLPRKKCQRNASEDELIPDFVNSLSGILSESNVHVLSRVFTILNKEKMMLVLEETLKIEREGGMYIDGVTAPDGEKKKRTMGGIYMRLLKTKYCTQDEVNQIFYPKKAERLKRERESLMILEEQSNSISKESESLGASTTT